MIIRAFLDTLATNYAQVAISVPVRVIGASTGKVESNSEIWRSIRRQFKHIRDYSCSLPGLHRLLAPLAPELVAGAEVGRGQAVQGWRKSLECALALKVSVNHLLVLACEG